MRYTLQILTKVAQKLGINEEEVVKYADVLEDNWYDSESTFKGLQPEDLKIMNIPDPIGKEIIAIAHGHSLNHMMIEGRITEDDNDTQIDFSESASRKYIDSFLAEPISKESKIETLELLLKIIGNILEHPENEKYRKLNSRSDKLVKVIFQYQPLCELFKFLRFESNAEQLLVLHSWNTIFPLLEFTRNTITDSLQKLRTDKSGDHFVFPAESLPAEQLKAQQEEEQRQTENMLKECQNEIQVLAIQFEELNKVYKFDSQVRIFKPTDPKSKQQSVQTNASPASSKEVADFVQSLNHFQEKYLDFIISNDEIKSTFHRISANSFGSSATIRVKMANGYILEFQVSPNKTIREFSEMIRSHLVYPAEPFYLQMLGISKNKYDPYGPFGSKTIRELDMYPDARLELVYESHHMRRFDKLLKCQL